MPQTTEQAVILQKPPPRNICNILFILICCDLCPCSLSHHSVRQFVVDFMRTVLATEKKQGEDVFFSSFTLLLVCCLRRYVGVVTTLRCYDCFTAESYDTSWSSTSCNCSFCSVSPSPCMSEVQSVRLSRRSCMMSVESL